ncbi:hypothetical protein, conserved [Trypanosoma brucei gambiense DAL972]|uniref:RRM domain-containing protein n=2 Tax=Trypanosoma brucei TaxID=5691 RepID=D0A7H9_TRYB9|nr:hypothetical protein, conserved [Trypanosoma brucei gambiense DAL972]CBH17630.1 hypothetical protein, conserved [Trypanosoma brucei gambiense DAL972]|eukprot:XP_011779894.1 hypothetical protein, conserved [Trypanosoma brucei gambiense DAL972]
MSSLFFSVLPCLPLFFTTAPFIGPNQEVIRMSEQNRDAAAELLEKYFDDNYLFEQTNSFFREKVSPRNTGDLKEPPTITCAAFLRYANCPVDEKNVAAVFAAAATSSVVEAVEGEGGVRSLRRRKFLDPKADPALRSVVVWPLHRASTVEEVTNFFKDYGTVQSAAALPRSPGDTQMNSSFVVRFATAEEAVRCTKAVITLGKAPTPLAQHFLPTRLRVVMLEDHHNKMVEKSRAESDAQLLHNVVQAQKALAELQDPAVRRSLGKGATLKVEGVPHGTSWATIKMKLGNLSLTNHALKKGITLVKVEDSDPASPAAPHRAFVVCRNAATANELLASYNLADGEFGRELRSVCPTLLPLTSEEEEYARRNFPEWCKRRVEAKQVHNNKRHRSAD